MQLLVLTLLYGGLYVVPVMIAPLVMRGAGGARSSEGMALAERALVFVPIIVYLVLEYLVQMRQGFSSWQAQGVLAVPGVVSATLSTRHRRWARASVMAAALAAAGLWWFYPGEMGWRLF